MNSIKLSDLTAWDNVVFHLEFRPGLGTIIIGSP